MKREVKIGIFLTGALLIMAVFIFIAGDLSTWFQKPGYELSVLFPSSTGLEKHAAVRLAGVKIGYVTDIRYSQENLNRIAAIASSVDLLFIEAYYLSERESQAHEKAHLTARQAGMIARLLEAKKVVAMHISPRYHDRTEEIYHELDNL